MSNTRNPPAPITRTSFLLVDTGHRMTLALHIVKSFQDVFRRRSSNLPSRGPGTRNALVVTLRDIVTYGTDGRRRPYSLESAAEAEIPEAPPLSTVRPFAISWTLGQRTLEHRWLPPRPWIFNYLGAKSRLELTETSSEPGAYSMRRRNDFNSLSSWRNGRPPCVVRHHRRSAPKFACAARVSVF